VAPPRRRARAGRAEDAQIPSGDELANDPEKWEPVFGKDHAQAKC
jgi:hypothetical protein